ncbi:helix-turn-helix domain-containing protein [Actinoplanes sp. Pm04-4]|uniref:Helix-turn-helix domain-containing protein n=1 Tax=Paractinoplanes pyxinae TaxID=2997416 RepID=A0ABT4B6V8_9ACTN|nr:transcriptional regulator [Actinoplanes pyxinae]MCY1141345.1 helix-turn-helix domain-containing protein [Actinoplanes pyxinae]
MPTRDWPQQEAFLRQLDELKIRHNIRHDSALAELAGISHTAISNWRKGKQRPSATLITRIATATDEPTRPLLAVAGLIEGQDDDANPLGDLDPLLQRIIAMYRASSPAQREVLISTLTPTVNMIASLQELERQAAEAVKKRSS